MSRTKQCVRIQIKRILLERPGEDYGKQWGDQAAIDELDGKYGKQKGPFSALKDEEEAPAGGVPMKNALPSPFYHNGRMLVKEKARCQGLVGVLSVLTTGKVFRKK